jgi:hypothetical protein
MRSEDAEWRGLLSNPEEAYPEKIKTVVSPTDYEKEEVEQGKSFYINNDIKGEERAEYARILKEYSDIFAWASTDLEGIPAELGEHSIDLQGRSYTGSTTPVQAQPEVFVDGEGRN